MLPTINKSLNLIRQLKSLTVQLRNNLKKNIYEYLF
jgi:hypothetical protein